MAVVFIRFGLSVAAACSMTIMLTGCRAPTSSTNGPHMPSDTPAPAAPATQIVPRAPGTMPGVTDRRAANDAVRAQALELQVDYHRGKAEEALRKGLYSQALKDLEKAAALLQVLAKENPRPSGKTKEVKEELFQLHCRWAVSLTEQGRRERDESACDAAIARYRRAAELFPERYPQIDDEIRKVLSVKQLIRAPDIRLSR